jgi:NAD(P)-dependent dehydrogenase (short-subunit alcohol dehydrogenase family)
MRLARLGQQLLAKFRMRDFEEDLDRVVTLNLKGTVYFFQAFGRLMIEQGAGSIIACSSVRAVTIEPGLGVYGSTKAAIGLLVKGFASEVGRFGVRVNAIAPSIAETALTEPFKQRPDIHKLYAAHTVFDRWSNASEVACAVAFLASDAASYVSGSTLFVDGGWAAIDGPPTGLTRLGGDGRSA